MTVPIGLRRPEELNDSLEALAAVLKAASGTDTLVLLGQLLDSVPIGVLVTDSSDALVCAYVNGALQRAIPAERTPIIGRPLGDVWLLAEENGVLAILKQAAASGQPKNLRDFNYVGLPGTRSRKPGDISVWDWGVYPLARQSGRVTHLLVVGRRQRGAQGREIASAIIRIFGADPINADLTKREMEVAELITEGLTNGQIAKRMLLGPSTIATHVSRILQKLGLDSRAQVAVWAVKRRLRSEA